MRFLKYLIIGSLLLGTFAYAETYGNIPKHIVFKGLNTKAGPVSLGEGESPNCLNVHTSLFGTLIKRKGYTKLNATAVTPITGVFNGLYDYAIDSTTNKLMAFVDTYLYKMDSLDGTFDQVTLVSALTNDVADFTNLDGTLIIGTWSRNSLQYWTGTGNTASVGFTPAGKYLITAYNRIFMGDCKDETGAIYPLRFYFSNVGSYTSWLTPDSDYQYDTLDAPNGDTFMGWGQLRGRLFGFTKYTVNLITDIGGADVVTVSRRVDGTGCGAPRSIKTINSTVLGESLIWLSNDKRLMMWNGSTLRDVGSKIQTDNHQSVFALNLITTANYYKSHAQVYEKEGWYVVWVPISANIDYCIVYDYNTDTVWAYSNQKFQSSVLMKTTSGNQIYVGNRTGTCYTWDSGTSDDNTAINGYWVSPKWAWDWMPMLKKMGEVQITTRTIGNYNLYYQFRYNWNTSYSTPEALLMYESEWLLGDVLPATLGGNLARVHRIPIDGAFNLFQMKVYDNSKNPGFEIYALDTITNNLGKLGE